jgi:hypothetical protein
VFNVFAEQRQAIEENQREAAVRQSLSSIPKTKDRIAADKRVTAPTVRDMRQRSPVKSLRGSGEAGNVPV